MGVILLYSFRFFGAKLYVYFEYDLKSDICMYEAFTLGVLLNSNVKVDVCGLMKEISRVEE